MPQPLTVLTLLKVKPSPNGEQHGERPFWREYGEQYLNAWLAGVAKYVPNPKRIVIMIDSLPTVRIPPQFRKDGVHLHFIPLDHDVNAPGFFAKLNMFRPEVSEGRCLYMDLDNVIAGDLSPLTNLTPSPLLMADDRRIPGLPNGSTILFDADRCHAIWDAYTVDPRRIEQEYIVRDGDYSRAFDQAFIADWYRITYGEEVPLLQEQLPMGFMLNAYSELPRTPEWQTARLIFGCGAAKRHTSTHPAYAFSDSST